jgi:hypothetical protein
LIQLVERREEDVEIGVGSTEERGDQSIVK